MSMNERVNEASIKMLDAYDVSTEAYETAKDNYFAVLESELKADHANHWISAENPADTLDEYIHYEEGKDSVRRTLDDYLRYCAVVERVTSKSVIDTALVAEAESYLM